MATIFEKLNLKDHTDIVVLNAPESFEAELSSLPGVTVHHYLAPDLPVRFALAFVQTQDQLDNASRALTARAVGDAILWIAYPKGSSKKYTCDFNRDSGWPVLRDAGFETVRQVAIDEDWTALRFRRTQYIKLAPKMDAVANERSR